jgi:hypothetical protein
MCCRNMQDHIDNVVTYNKAEQHVTGKINKLSSKGDNSIIIGHISSHTYAMANAFKFNLPLLMSNFVE